MSFLKGKTKSKDGKSKDKDKKLKKKNSVSGPVPSAPISVSSPVLPAVSAPDVANGGWSKPSNTPDPALIAMLKMQCEKEMSGSAPERNYIAIEKTEEELEAQDSASSATNAEGIGAQEYEIEEEDGLVFTGEVANGRPIIKGGRIEKLVERLTYTKYSDSKFLHAFLLTFRSFCTPSEFLELLKQRYDVEPPEGSSEEDIETFNSGQRKTIRLKVNNVLKHWITTGIQDFLEDEELKNSLVGFVDGKMKLDMEGPANSLMKLLNKKLADPLGEEEKKKRQVFTGNSAPVPHLPNSAKMKDLKVKLLGYHPQELARQLTLIEYDLYAAIQAPECVSQNWMHKTRKNELAPNILRMISRFNEVSTWVASEVVKCKDLPSRIQCLKHFIDMADYCQQLNNINGCMEIVSGLQSSSVFRLKQTWGGLDKQHTKMFDELRGVMSRDNNYRDLRAYLHSVDPPCIPYLGMYLTDLTFIEEGNKDNLPDGQGINFQKRQRLSEVISEVQIYQNTPYNLEPVAFIQDYLFNAESLPEEQCYKKSLRLEGRGGATVEQTDEPYEPYGEMEKLPGYLFNQPDSADNIVFEGKQTAETSFVPIVSATLPKLLERLTYHKYQDMQFVWAFLTTYKEFSNPDELLDLLVMRFKMPKPKNPSKQQMDTFTRTEMVPIQFRIINVIKCWINTYYADDFADNDSLRQRVESNVEDFKQFNPIAAKAADQLTAALKKQAEEEPAPEPELFVFGSGTEEGTQTIVDFPEAEIAATLTLLDHEYLSCITAREIALTKSFEKEEVAEGAPHVHAWLAHTSTVRRWIATEVVRQGNVDHRANVLSFLIRLVTKLMSMRNFNSAMTIMAALKDIQGEIEPTWAFVADDIISKFKELIKMTAGQVKDLEKTDVPTFTIPHFQHHLARIKTVRETMPDHEANGTMVHFKKFSKLYDAFKVIEGCQARSPSLEDVDTTQFKAYLTKTLVLSDPDIKAKARSFERVTLPERRQSFADESGSGAASSSSGSGAPVLDLTPSQVKTVLLGFLSDDADGLSSLAAELRKAVAADLQKELSNFSESIANEVLSLQEQLGLSDADTHNARESSFKAGADDSAAYLAVLRNMFDGAAVTVLKGYDDDGWVLGEPGKVEGFQIVDEGEKLVAVVVPELTKETLGLNLRILDFMLELCGDEEAPRLVFTTNAEANALEVADHQGVLVKYY